jgi:hypothetical protein
LAFFLVMAGHEIRVAVGDAAALAEARSYRPHVALVDISLPGCCDRSFAGVRSSAGVVAEAPGSVHLGKIGGKMRNPKPATRAHSLVLAALLLLLAAAPGCRRLGTVSGKVSIDDQLVTVGTVTFVPEQGRALTCSIEPDGRYSLPNVPPGSYAVSVVSAQPSRYMLDIAKKKAEREGAARSKPLTFRPIPPRYNDPSQSRLTCDVRGGCQEYHIDLHSP